MKEVRTTCPYCGVGCGLVAEVDGGRLTGVRGDKLHPVNRGATCRKPLRLPDAVYAPDRALRPLVRESRDARWRAASWRSAIPSVARRLRAIVDRHGPNAVAFYISGQLLTEDYYVVNKLAKGFIGTNNVDSNSRLCMSSAVAGYTAAFGSDGPPSCYADIDQTDCVLMLGSNAAACHPIVWARIRRRRDEGAQIIVADPRRTETAAAADIHLPVRPGGDLALLNAMIHVIARDGLIDDGFVARRTEGAEAALATAAEWTPERAAEVCGVQAELIEDTARRFARAKRAMAIWSMGANQSTVGTLKNLALINLCLLTGNLGRPGTGPFSLTGQPNAMGGRESGGLSTLLPGYRKVTDAEDRAAMRRLWRLPDDAPGVSPEPGIAATELADALHDGRIKAVWIVATNPVVSQPDSERFAAGLRAAELVVVQDAYHPTETSALADVVLPAAQWPEKDGVMTNSERRVSLVRRAIKAPGVALPDWEIFARTGRALGWGESFAWQSAAEVFEEYVATTRDRLCDMTGLSHERLLREGALQWPVPERAGGHVGTERLYRSGRLPTPSGRARIVATPHADPADAVTHELPLMLTTGRLVSQWHTMTRTGKSPDLVAEAGEPFVELHPTDAARARIKGGQRARIVSRRGVAHVRARVVDTLPEGVAFAPFHWGALNLEPGDEPVNRVVSAALDPTSRQAELKATAVRVEPMPSGTGGRSARAERERVVVVGGGMAGLALTESLLAHDPDRFAVTVVGAEPELPYDRVRLSHALSGEAVTDQLVIRAAGWYEEHEVDVRTSTRADAIADGVVRLAGGDELPFDRLALATGSTPARPPIAGLHRRGVHVFRSLRDVRQIAAGAQTARRAVVIGGGLLGLEAARGLQLRGVRVTVVHLADRLLEQQLDGPSAGLLATRLRRLGIEVRLNAATTEVAGNGKVEGVELASGDALDADLVVVATGVRPDTRLAASAGIEVRRGIVVDDELRTSRPGTWAIGECAEHPSGLYGLWAPSLKQARVAAAVMAGRPAAFHGAVPATTLKVAGVDLFCAGRSSADPEAGEEEVLALDSRAGRYRKLVLAGERLVGAILLGDLSEAAMLRSHVETGRPVPAELLDAGAPARDEGPPGALVCSCNGVTRETIECAISKVGCDRVADVARATGATTGCGGCRTEVEKLIAARKPERLRDARSARAGIR